MKLDGPLNLHIDHKDAVCVKTLFLVDILRMREINEVYGYLLGNKLLSQFVSCFNEYVIPEIKATLQKFGLDNIHINFSNRYADIFSLTIHNDLDDRLILKIEKIIFELITNYDFILEKSKLNINITLGCSKGDNDELVVIHAEKALYNAKVNYQHYAYYDDQFNNDTLLNKNMLEIIQENINNKKVVPYFQEIVSSKGLRTHKYEALMRLVGKNGNILSPFAFLEKAKKFRLYPKLMEIMIEKVFDIVLMHNINVSINLDYHDLTNPTIKKFILNRLEQDKQLGNHLTVEILESEKIHDFEKVNDFIHELRKYNVLVAIDDFGTGFANYEHILQLNIDYIKLDGSLVKRINEEMYYNLIKSIVDFCEKHDIKIVAEFVTSLPILELVRSLKINYSQGYYIAKPKPIDKLMKEN